MLSSDLLDNPDPLVHSLTYIRFSDPLVLDLAGDGLSITPLKATPPVLFDTDADGVKTATAWIGSDDGLVVFDRNNNGTIDSGAELLGDEWVLRNGPNAGKQATHGFTALADFDSNGDGTVNASDAQFGALRLWRDLNQDGISQAGELQTLAASGVQSIKVASSLAMVSYGDAMLIQDGSFVRSDGTTGQAGAFVLSQNLRVREGTPITLSEEAKVLPDVKGTGFVRDLREAATESPGLAAMVQAAMQAPTRAAFEQKLSDLLIKWGNSSGYEHAGKDALEAGYGLILSEPEDAQELSWMNIAVKGSESTREAFRVGLSGADQTKFDAMRERMVGGLEKLYAYEALTGFTFLDWTTLLGHVEAYQPPSTSGTPVPIMVGLSTKFQQDRSGIFSEVPGYIRVTPPTETATLWPRLMEDALERMLPVLRTQQHLDKIAITVSESGLSLDFSELNASVSDVASESAYEGAALLLDLQRDFGAQLTSQGWDGLEQLRGLAQQASSNAQIQQAFADHGSRVFLPGQSAGTVADEVFLGASSNDSFNAGGGADVLLGGDGNDSLSGGSGDDLLQGEDGNDILAGEDGHDLLEGAAGADNLSGGGGDDSLEGATGADTLSGGGGNDTLIGGADRDHLSGGSGNDVFRFDAPTDSGIGASLRDFIADFGAGDLIDLSAIDADPVAGDDQSFAFVGSAAFSAAGQVRYHHESGQTIVEADIDGNAVADFEIGLAGVLTLTAASFVL